MRCRSARRRAASASRWSHARTWCGRGGWRDPRRPTVRRDRRFPVVLHHGLVGSAHVARPWAQAAREAGIELISVARPGYGRSKPVTMSCIADWADMVSTVLGPLYGIWAVSAGAPYAYALAAAQPTRVTSVAVTSGLGHVADQRVRALYSAESQRAFDFFRTGDHDDVREYWYDELRAELSMATGDWAGALRDSLAHRGAGPGREAVLQQRPWGVDLASIDVPVHIWHSRYDPTVPLTTAERMADAIPGAVLRVQESDEHVPSDDVVAEALAILSGVRCFAGSH